MNFIEQQVLLSLWRWKLLSTAAITEMHYRHLSPATAYFNLMEMCKKHFICAVPFPGKASDFLWSLSPKGFGALREVLDSLREDGYKSETLRHDALVTAIHIGEWLKGTPDGCDLFSEQELRRKYFEHYPEWVPNMDIHRADGYWLTKIGDRSAVLALEVELTRKRRYSYRGIGGFYSHRKNVFRVIWVVSTMGLARHIQNEIKAVHPVGYLCHDFILLKDFLVNGWYARFVIGRENGLPLSLLLGCGDEKTTKHVWSFFLLNTKKSPHRSHSYHAYRKLLNSDRVGTYNLPACPSNEDAQRGSACLAAPLSIDSQVQSCSLKTSRDLADSSKKGIGNGNH